MSALLNRAVMALFFCVLADVSAGEIIRVPADYPSISEAMAAATDGDEVVIADGTYSGEGNRELDFQGKRIIVRSENGPDKCIVDCQESGRAFRLVNGEGRGAVIRGLQIIYSRRAAIEIVGASPTIDGCVFRDNEGSYGGAIEIREGAPTIMDCVFEGNRSVGGDVFGGGAIYTEGNPSIVGCTFVDNYSRGEGGAVFAADGTFEAVDCVFMLNVGRNGGAILSRGGLVENCVFIDNYINIHGDNGGAINHDRGDLIVRNSRISGGGAERGGGIYSRGRRVAITNSEIHDTFSPLGGIHVGNGGNLSISNCLLWRNETVEGGGGVYVIRGATDITNTSIVENSAIPPGMYAGVFASEEGTATLRNCLLWNNTPSEAGGPGVINISHSIIRGGWAGEGNIDADPLFVDAENGDLRLMAGSPAIDSGDNLAVPADEFDLDDDGDTEEPVPFDLDGYARFVDDPDTDDTGRCGEPCERPIVDMGAYEFGMAFGACCIEQIGECKDGLSDEQCIDTGGRFEPDTLCENLDPPCAAPPCIREPAWQCDGDVDGDGQVNPVDSGLVQAAFCPAEDCPADALCQYDLDCDNQINPVDSGIVQSLFGTCDPPRAVCP